MRNFELRKRAVARPIECVNINAMDFEFPNEKMVVFLFNPFGQSVLRAVLGNLERSLATNFRDVFVVFAMHVPEFMRMADT